MERMDMIAMLIIADYGLGNFLRTVLKTEC